MLKNFKGDLRKKFFQIQSFFLSKLIKCVLLLFFKTYHVQVEGLDPFLKLAGKKKCIIMLWHNQLAPILPILSNYTPSHIHYSAVVSASRDGDVLSNVIHSYKRGDTIRVPHHARYQALRNLIEIVEKGDRVVVMTPDGPRGPRYEMKPGIAVAALETQAHVIPLSWEAKDYWELNSWDKFRIPKPFTTLKVTFGSAVCFDQAPQPSLEEAKSILKALL